MRDDVYPEESPDCQQLVDGCAEQQVEEINFTCVLQAHLLNDIHDSSRNLRSKREDLGVHGVFIESLWSYLS